MFPELFILLFTSCDEWLVRSQFFEQKRHWIWVHYGAPFLARNFYNIEIRIKYLLMQRFCEWILMPLKPHSCSYTISSNNLCYIFHTMERIESAFQQNFHEWLTSGHPVSWYESWDRVNAAWLVNSSDATIWKFSTISIWRYNLHDSVSRFDTNYQYQLQVARIPAY